MLPAWSTLGKKTCPPLSFHPIVRSHFYQLIQCHLTKTSYITKTPNISTILATPNPIPQIRASPFARLDDRPPHLLPDGTGTGGGRQLRQQRHRQVPTATALAGAYGSAATNGVWEEMRKLQAVEDG